MRLRRAAACSDEQGDIFGSAQFTERQEGRGPHVFIRGCSEQVENTRSRGTIASIGQGIQQSDLSAGVELWELRDKKFRESRAASRGPHLLESRRAEFLVVLTDELDDGLDELVRLGIGRAGDRRRKDERQPQNQATAPESSRHRAISPRKTDLNQ
jgi:hypothetical protein